MRANACRQPNGANSLIVVSLVIAQTWLSLARHEDAMNELLGNWSEAGSVTSHGIKPAAVQVTLPF
jgi:hypothetical protein